MTRRGRLLVPLLSGAMLLALVAPGGASAEIVYTHGKPSPSTSSETYTPSSLWAMNDDGSDPHLLLSPSQVPNQLSITGASLQPHSQTLVFEGIDPQDAGLYGSSGAYSEGIYTLSNRTVNRLSPQTSYCGSCSIWAGDARLTADGRIVYQVGSCSSNASGPFACAEKMSVMPVTGGTASGWETTPTPLTYVTDFSADPANGGLLAYESSSVSPPNQLEIGNQSASETTVVATQPNGDLRGSPAWSPDGSELVDVDATPVKEAGKEGFSAGLWLFSASAGGAPRRELLVDPHPGHPGPLPGEEFPGSTFSEPVFVGQDEVAFVAESNLWEVPTSCDMCTFPAGAKQLTSDGTSAVPDTGPAWTAETIEPPGGGEEKTPGADPIAKLKLAAKTIRAGKPVTFEVTLTAVAKVTIAILREVPPAGHGHHNQKPHYKLLGKLVFSGKSGLNKFAITKVKGHRLTPGKYEAKVSAGGAEHTVKFTIRR